MQTQLIVKDPAFVFDFILVQARMCWPAAVLLDQSCNTRDCTNQLTPTEYGCDIFPSQHAVEEFIGGTTLSENSTTVNVRLAEGQLHLLGDQQVITHLQQHPLWKS